jgi:hypothetical protein
LDLIVPANQAETLRTLLIASGLTWDEKNCEFRTGAGIPVQFLVAGERAGRDSEVRLPDPGNPNAIVELEGLSVLSLAALIESKIACGQSNLRRTHKDFADVVELVARHQLGRDFARHLHKSVRATFRQLVMQSRAD